MTLDEIPIFVKSGTILPLADPLEYITPKTIFNITCHVFGNPAKSTILFEDDGETFNFEKGEFNQVELSWEKNKGKVVRIGKQKCRLYQIKNWINY